TQLAGRISLTDSEAGGTPQVSPSNKPAFMDRAVTVDADGKESEVWLDLTANNYLNGQGVVTVNNFDGGWKFWGNRTACYPSVTDPRDAFIPIRRFFNWYRNTFILTYFQQVDAPLTRRLITTFLKSEQLRLDGLTAREVINGGRISFLEPENPLTDLMDGLLRFHLWICPPPPARAVEGVFEFDPTYLQTLFGEE
ncbi:MAG: phage tail sheath protein, partial [Desulfovibrionaceae bacterium]|nr:phage tail sheath protein [Desulfovibrionaceae bacterium]